MPRLDLYRFVHKGQRFRLLGLIQRAGSFDPSAAPAVRDMRGAIGDLAVELREHACHEDRFIHPLLARHAPEVLARLEQQHVAVDAALAELEAVACPGEDAADDCHRMYLALATFAASYLPHLDCEERQAMPALWSTCPEEDLMDVMVRFRASQTPASMIVDLRRQLPALTPAERALYTSGVLAVQPPLDRDAILTASRSVLSSPEFDALWAALAA